MIHRFGDFELDERRRELRLGGRELVLQPKVFDVLVHLVRQGDQVVRKNDLLDAVWSDVVVADGALQRAVSLARSALRQGGLDDAIRTHAGLGYRFCVESTTAAAVTTPARPEQLDEPLERARRAFEQGDWHGAFTAFVEADRQSPLEGPDLERQGEAAHAAGLGPDDALRPLQRAVTAHAAAGDCRGAARAAFQLAHIHFDRRELAVAMGWRGRLVSYLEGLPETREHGMLAVLDSRIACFEGELDDAVSHAHRALEIGRRLEDPDLEALGLEYGGLALLSRGDVQQGIAQQDEAAALVLSGGVSPWAGSMIYCAVIWGCLNRVDWERAGQWTDHFTRWCESLRMAPFTGLCRLHRAEVLVVRGELAEAEDEIQDCQRALSVSAPYAEGDAYRVLGEIRLARGDCDGAEQAFRKSYELGWDPQPGRALLQVRQGNAEAALRALERSVQAPGWANQQRKGLLLAHLVIVAVAAGQLDRARAALAQLDGDPELWSTPALEAAVLRARGEVAYADGECGTALGLMRQALQRWQAMGSALNAASLRLRITELLLADGDRDTAELELSAAETIFERVGAAELLDDCAQMRRAFERVC
jgi:DNA-binding winged helix-turn-helix (wHTH) protein